LKLATCRFCFIGSNGDGT